MQSQYDRAVFGLNPTTGDLGRPPSAATRFLSHWDQLNVITRAEQIYKNTGLRDLAQKPIQFNSAIGTGFQKGTLDYGIQYLGRIFLDESGKAITAFPVWGN